MSILRVKDDKGNIIPITAIKGDKGDKGDRGDTGVYVGSGAIPNGCNVKIDPNGEADDVVTKVELDQAVAKLESKITTGSAADATYSNSASWVTKNMNVAAAKSIVVSIWDGTTKFFNPTVLPIKSHFSINTSICLNYGEFYVEVKRSGENQIQLITSGNTYAYVAILV